MMRILWIYPDPQHRKREGSDPELDLVPGPELLKVLARSE